jgi:hypothetical protein
MISATKARDSNTAEIGRVTNTLGSPPRCAQVCPRHPGEFASGYLVTRKRLDYPEFWDRSTQPPRRDYSVDWPSAPTTCHLPCRRATLVRSA